MSESDLKSLKDLASMVEEELGKRLAPASEETLGKKAEAALKEAEARLRLALQAGRIGTWDWNIVTGKIVWSSGHEALWGMAPGEFKGTYEEFEARLHPKDREGMNRAVAESIAKRRTYRHEFRIVWPDGSTHWIAGQGEPFFDEAGRPVRMLGMVVDITERKQIEEALRESEERLRLALDAAQMGTFDWDIPHNRLVWSRGHEKLWGLAPGEFGGTYEAFSERVHPEDLPGIQTEVARCIAAREPISREFRVVWPDGSVHWVLGRGEFTFGEDGRPLRMRGVALETTARHRVEEALHTNRELLNNIIDSTPSYVFATDRQNRYTLINKAATGLLGMPKEEILGRTEHDLFPKELADALQAANNRVMATGVPLQIEEVVGGKAGPPRTMITVKFPVRDTQGKIIGLGGVATDITERKRAEEALRESEQMNREQYAELHQLYQTAPVGLALVDHELRFVRINDRLAEINGRPAEQHIGRTISEVLPQLWPSLEPIYRRVMSGEPVLDVQIHGVTPAQPGAERDWVASYYPVLGDDGFVRGVSMVVQEVTESKQAEEALRKSEERLRLVTLATHDAIWDWDLATNTIWWNETFKETFRYQTEEIKSGFEFWESLIHPEDRERLLSDLQATIDKGEQFLAEEYRLRRGDGSYATVLDRGFVLRDQNGKPVRMVGAITDITDRKQAEQALQEAEARLRLALQAGRIGTWDWNMTTGKIVWSRGHEELWGMAPGTFKGTYEEFEARLHPEDRERVNRILVQAAAERRTVLNEFRIVWPDGSVHWIAGRGEPLYDDTGQPVRMIGVVMDITERKQAEEALRKSEERFQLASRATNDAIWDWDLVTNAVQWNERFQTLFGYQPEEIESGVESWTNRIHPEDKGWVLSELDDAIKQGDQFWSGEYRFRRRDGSYAVVFDRGYVVHDENGRPVRMIGAMLDITERKRAEEALSESENRLRQILDGLFGFVGLYTLDGTMIEVNEAPLLAGGVKREEVLGRPFWETYWWNYDQRVQAELKDAMARAARGERVRYEPVVRMQGDRLITVDTTFGPLRDRSGKVAFILAFGVDITERKRAEKAIRELNQDLERRVADRTAQLEAANKELESFSYSVSHDLRAPLRAISGFSRVLLLKYADRLDREGKDFLQRVDAASRRMGELIENLLNLSRVTRSEIRKEPVDLTLLARSIAEDLQRSDPKRRVTFLIQEGLKASADPHLLRIVLENLLGNAWKFTSKHPTATIEIGRIEKNGNPVYFVRDDGAGFDMAYADKLFGAFQRLHSLNEFVGTGVGLASVQRIIRRHGGKVWAEGAVEKGATFYFTL